MTSPYHSDGTSPYGCHNRAPFRDTLVVQDGWLEINDGFGNPTRCAQWKRIPFRNRPDCGYTVSKLGQQDPRCEGCKWKAAEEQHG